MAIVRVVLKEPVAVESSESNGESRTSGVVALRAIMMGEWVIRGAVGGG